MFTLRQSGYLQLFSDCCNIASTSTFSSRSSTASDDSTLRRGNFCISKTLIGIPTFEHTSSDAPAHIYSADSSSGVAVFLTLDKAPVAGEPVGFTVKVINKQSIAKVLKVHLNAQAKEYNHSPSDTFWETHGIVQMAPMEGKFTFIHRLKCSLKMDCCGVKTLPLSPSAYPAKVVHQQILPAQYEDVVGDDLINLAVVLEDMNSQERVLASEEFNIASPQLTIEVIERDSDYNEIR